VASTKPAARPKNTWRNDYQHNADKLNLD